MYPVFLNPLSSKGLIISVVAFSCALGSANLVAATSSLLPKSEVQQSALPDSNASSSNASRSNASHGVSDQATARDPANDRVRAADDRWSLIREQLFGDTVISEDGNTISLDAPPRAFDAARVPITVRALTSQNPENFIEKLFLVVDKNPVPVASTFTFQPNDGWQTLDTELRINEYSYMRVVAQMNDGSLHMQSSFVKAAGGCSAAPSSYDRSDVNRFGTFEASIKNLLDPKIPALARIRIIHPNASGMQFDQMTRTYIPAHYIHTMGAEFNGEPLFTVETNFSLSQDPVLGFNFEPSSDGQLKMYALDSENTRFEKSWDVEVPANN